MELVEIDGPVVYLKLQGACGSCPSSLTTMTMGIKRRLQEKIPVSSHHNCPDHTACFVCMSLTVRPVPLPSILLCRMVRLKRRSCDQLRGWKQATRT